MNGADDKGAGRGWAAVAIIVALWTSSLLLPALSVAGGPTLTGYELLLQGWQGASRGVFAWYANLFFAAAVVAAAARRSRVALVASGAAVVLALTSFAADDLLRRRMESVPELTLLAGFYVWLAALLAAFLVSWRRVYLQHRDYPRR